MKDFYVQLTSNASTTEFPANVPPSLQEPDALPVTVQGTGMEHGTGGRVVPPSASKDRIG